MNATTCDCRVNAMHAANQNANKKNGTMYVDNTPLFHFQPIPSIKSCGWAYPSWLCSPYKVLGQGSQKYFLKSQFSPKVKWDLNTEPKNCEACCISSRSKNIWFVLWNDHIYILVMSIYDLFEEKTATLTHGSSLYDFSTAAPFRHTHDCNFAIKFPLHSSKQQQQQQKCRAVWIQPICQSDSNIKALKTCINDECWKTWQTRAVSISLHVSTLARVTRRRRVWGITDA